MHRPKPRHAPVALIDSPPADLVAVLLTLADVTTVEDAEDVLAFVPMARRPSLLAWMVGRRTYSREALHAVLTSVPVPELRQAVGEQRAENWLRLYG